jgi:tetratricopeptide (TPR) repeat protein
VIWVLRPPLVIALLATVLWIGVSPSGGQGRVEEKPPLPSLPATKHPRDPVPPRSRPPADSEKARAIREAQLLIREGKYEDALTRLGAMKDEPGTDPQILLLRGTCLRLSGKLSEAEKLYRDEADATASRHEDPSPMLIELERVLRQEKNPERAFEICLEIHRLGKGAAVWVVDEMESLIQADSLGEVAVRALKSEISKRPQAADLSDLLVSAYLFVGRPNDALRITRENDAARKAQGRILLEYLRFLDRKGLPAPAIDAADAAIAAGLTGDEKQEAMVLRAGALRRLRQYPEAAEGYERAAAVTPDGPLASIALKDRADLLAGEMGDLDGAAKAYEGLISSLRTKPAANRGRVLGEALVSLANCRLHAGRYEDAASLLSQVESLAPDSRSKEEAAFQQAEILFFAGRPDTAEQAYGRVVKQYSGGTRVNDALDRLLLLVRCAGAGEVSLAALGQIAYQRRIGSPARGLEICHEATKVCGSCAAAEDLLREEALLLLDAGNLDEAAARADTLATRYPDGSSGPMVLKAVADKMRETHGDVEPVIRRYEDILVRYPKSHEAFEVRAILAKSKRPGTSDRLDERPEDRG